MVLGLVSCQCTEQAWKSLFVKKFLKYAIRIKQYAKLHYRTLVRSSEKYMRQNHVHCRECSTVPCIHLGVNQCSVEPWSHWTDCPNKSWGILYCKVQFFTVLYWTSRKLWWVVIWGMDRAMRDVQIYTGCSPSMPYIVARELYCGVLGYIPSQRHSV